MSLVADLNSHTAMFTFLTEDICRTGTPLFFEAVKSRVRPVKGAHRSSNRKLQHQNTKTIKEDAHTARGGVSEMQSRDSGSPVAVGKHLPTQIGVLGSFGEEELNMEGPHESPFRRKGT